MKNKKKLFTVTDLGGGDGGKGGVVHKIASMQRAHTIVKVGGAQGCHGVWTSRGEHFAFSQFGCGTFEGAATFVSHNFVIDPHTFLIEGESLQREWRIPNPFDAVCIDEDALSITPYHRFASRLRELARRDHPRGTVGVGVGEAYRDAQLHPELAIYARDFGCRDLRDKLEAVRQQKLAELEAVIAEGFAEADHEIADEMILLLKFPGLSDWACAHYRKLASLARIVDRDYLAREVLGRDGVVVVESSHGILTDHYQGFHPHTSKMRTLPELTTHNMLRECGYDGHVFRLGVTRAYQIRHGAGPMVTEDPSMNDALLPGSHKDDNRYQGKVRVGPLDFVMLRYAIASCGGSQAFDGIALAWFDQIQQNGVWNVCDRYHGALNPTFFTPEGEVRVRFGNDDAQLAHQEELGNLLRGCRPVVDACAIDSTAAKPELVTQCSEIIQEKLGVPVRMVAFGPTETDKVCC